MWVDRAHYYGILRDKAVLELRVRNLEERMEISREFVIKANEAIREERNRADRALDTQLMARGQAPIADPGRMIEADDPFVEDPAILSAMRKEMEQSGGSLSLFVDGLEGLSTISTDNPDTERVNTYDGPLGEDKS